MTAIISKIQHFWFGHVCVKDVSYLLRDYKTLSGYSNGVLWARRWPLHHSTGRGGGVVRLVVATHSPRNLAYDDKQVTSPAIFNHVCAESCVRTCARAGSTPYTTAVCCIRTDLKVRKRYAPFVVYFSTNCAVHFIGLVGDSRTIPLWLTTESN